MDLKARSTFLKDAREKILNSNIATKSKVILLACALTIGCAGCRVSGYSINRYYITEEDAKYMTSEDAKIYLEQDLKQLRMENVADEAEAEALLKEAEILHAVLHRRDSSGLYYGERQTICEDYQHIVDLYNSRKLSK